MRPFTDRIRRMNRTSLRDASQHVEVDFFRVIERKDEIGPSGTDKNPMGAPLSFNDPAEMHERAIGADRPS
jgi:hypothetical protein